MIETRQAIENIDAILDVPGIDAIYVGPADLAFSLGKTPKLDSEDAEQLGLTTIANDSGLMAKAAREAVTGVWREISEFR
jgi:2-keto-3-deoxy-L-rhamnonate aldolase RhmA